MKQDTPDIKDTNPFIKDGKLDTEVIAKFQEALKTDTVAASEIAKSLGAAPTPNQPTSKTPGIDIEKYKEIYAFALDGLKSAGIDPTVTPIQSKMSEYEKAISGKVETMALAKFSEQLSDITKVDKDFPVEALSKLDVPTEIKITVANAIKGVVSRNAEGISKLQKELDGITGELKEVKAKAPAEPQPDTRAGSDRVKEMAAKFGLNVSNIEGLKDESTPDAKTQLAQAIQALAKEN